MLNDPSNQMNPTQTPGSSSQSGYLPNFQTSYMNPEDLALFSQWKLQQQQQQQPFTQFTPFSQPQTTPSQPNSDHASYHLVDEDEDEEEEDDEEQPEPTPTSKKSRAKSMAKKPKSKAKTKKKSKEKEDDEDDVPTRPRTLWTQGEEHLLAECFIQISEDPKVGADQKQDTFWYKVLDAYNAEAKRLKYAPRTKNMLTGKWTPMNRDVKKWNTVVDETAVMSGENDRDFMTRCHILFKKTTGLDFKHMSAWEFLKDKHKWKNPDSTLARRNRIRHSQEEPEHFGPDEVPRPDGMYRVSKSQRSSNSTASSGSNPALFQEMLQMQIELDRKAKMDVLERESLARVNLYESQKVAEEMRVLQMDTSMMDPVNARIVRAQQARIRAKYPEDFPEED